jgi:hypothetical protein
MNAQRGSSPVERILQHVIQALLVVAIVGVFVALSELRTATAVAKVELIQLNDHLATFRTLVDDRYTGTDAIRDFNRVNRSINDHEIRIRKVEGEHGRLLPRPQKFVPSNPLRNQLLDKKAMKE